MIRGELTALIAMCLLVGGLIPIAFSVLDRVTRRSKENGGNLTRADVLEGLGLLMCSVGLATLCTLMTAFGWFWILEVPVHIMLGWVTYLERVIKAIEPDALSVVSAVVCGAVVVFGTHVFLRWLASTASREWRLKRTLQLLLLVVMLFVIGLAFTGLIQQTGWLIRTPDPLVHDARKIMQPASERIMTRRGFTVTELIVVIAIIIVLIGLLLPDSWLFEIPFTLALGWTKYLWRVIPHLNPDPWTVGTAVVCFAGVVVGSHHFLRWLAAGEWLWRRTFRCVGLIVLMFVAGISMVGMTHQTAWLVRSPEPLVSGSYTVARMHSANNLKQIGIAVHSRHDDLKSPEIARSTFNSAGQPMHSWQTALLPYIEQDHAYKQIDHAKPWTYPANAGAMQTRIPTFLNASINTDKVNDFAASHYAGNATVVLGDAKTLQSFGDGTSNTILAGEVSSNFAAWGDPLNARDPRHGASGQPNGFGGPRRPAQFVMLDGSVRTIDPKELAELMSKVPE